MSEPVEYTVEVDGHDYRVWEKGEGRPFGYLAGIGGLTAWTPFLDRMAERRRVIVPSLPGFPGAQAFRHLDSHLDWLVTVEALLLEAGITDCDLMGVSVGGTLAADIAAVWPEMFSRLVLLAPLGLYDPEDPTADVWAQRPGTTGTLLCADPANYDTPRQRPDGVDDVEWEIVQNRAMEAAARLLWPVGDTRLARRLGRVRADTLLLWGTEDKVLPFSYAARFADAIDGNTQVDSIGGAGHLADLDQPEAVAARVLEFLS